MLSLLFSFCRGQMRTWPQLALGTPLLDSCSRNVWSLPLPSLGLLPGQPALLGTLRHSLQPSHALRPLPGSSSPLSPVFAGGGEEPSSQHSQTKGSRLSQLHCWPPAAALSLPWRSHRATMLPEDCCCGRCQVREARANVCHFLPCDLRLAPEPPSLSFSFLFYKMGILSPHHRASVRNR